MDDDCVLVCACACACAYISIEVFWKYIQFWRNWLITASEYVHMHTHSMCVCIHILQGEHVCTQNAIMHTHIYLGVPRPLFAVLPAPQLCYARRPPRPRRRRTSPRHRPAANSTAGQSAQKHKKPKGSSAPGAHPRDAPAHELDDIKRTRTQTLPHRTHVSKGYLHAVAKLARGGAPCSWTLKPSVIQGTSSWW